MSEPEPERSRWARYRDRRRGGPPRPLKPHGTPAAYRRHQRAGEEPCAECRAAWSEHQAAMYRQRRSREATRDV